MTPSRFQDKPWIRMLLEGTTENAILLDESSLVCPSCKSMSKLFPKKQGEKMSLVAQTAAYVRTPSSIHTRESLHQQFPVGSRSREALSAFEKSFSDEGPARRSQRAIKRKKFDDEIVETASPYPPPGSSNLGTPTFPLKYITFNLFLPSLLLSKQING